ncbi:MAG: APC family permease [Elusimicrobiota bacterium]|nr:MAG: APC family permease [Elusimicrobiota bacterium]
MSAPGSRQLSRFDLLCLGVNAVVGSSVFLFPGRLAGLLGAASPAAYALTALLLAPVALCFAEAASRHDRAGGPALYAHEEFGPTAGFAIGWLCWITMIVSWAAVANGIAAYLPGTAPWAGKAVAAAAIAAFGALNWRGVRLGAWTTDFFTVAKLVPIALIAAAGLKALPAWRPETGPQGWAPLGPACFLAYFAFQGFETVPVPAGEAKDPKRDVPFAVLAALGGSAVLYLLVQIAALSLVPGLAASERPLADAASALMGPWGAGLVTAGAVISMTGYVAGSALGGPRYLVALSEEGHLPRRLAAAHPRFGTPSASILCSTAVAFVAALLLDFDGLVDFSNVVIGAQFLSTCAVVLRRRARAARGSWAKARGAAMPAAGMAATVWLGAQGGWKQVAASAVVLAAGFALRAGARSLDKL